MAVIRPFKAVRPLPEVAEKVAALPYDVMTSDEAREITKDNKYSFLHIDKAEIDLDKDINIYDDKVYQKANDNLNKMIKDGSFIQDEKPKLYIYRLTMNGRSQIGLVTCTSIDEYIDEKIKKHELTREDKEQDRIRHVDICNANTGPIFLTYRYDKNINDIMENWINKNSPIYDFVSDDDISHTVWIIDNDNTINDLIQDFKSIHYLYIADGHHRNASAVKVGLKRRESNPNYLNDAEFNFYLSVIFPDEQLHIMDYNRLVKDLNGLNSESFIEKIKSDFDINKYSDKEYFNPKEMHTFGMYLNKQWYILKAKDNIIDESNPVDSLDVSILQKKILEPILGIKDPRTDKRIDFVGGIRGLKELVKRVDSGEMKVAFSMYPTTMKQLMDIADAKMIMPPKSTWFEPKLRSGLFIHKLD